MSTNSLEALRTFQKNWQHSFSNLSMHYFMTPTYLSTLLMLEVLPRPIIQRFEENEPLQKKIQNILARYRGSKEIKDDLKKIEIMYVPNTSNPTSPTQHHRILFCGNAQDAFDAEQIYYKYLRFKDDNLIFWNYPGVDDILECANTPDDLVKAGYQMVKKLIEDKNIAAEHVTLHGHSLGGSVAIHVARKLYEEGCFVNIEIDRTFSRIESVIPETIQIFFDSIKNYDIKARADIPKANMQPGVVYIRKYPINYQPQYQYFVKDSLNPLKLNNGCVNNLNHKQMARNVKSNLTDPDFKQLVLASTSKNGHTYSHLKYFAPWVSSTVAMAISGIALGTTLAGLLSSVGLVANGATEGIGVLSALCFDVVGILLHTSMTNLGLLIAFGFFSSAATREKTQVLFEDMGSHVAYPFLLISQNITRLFRTMAYFIHQAFKLIGSILGGLIAICGLVAGGLAGLILGAILSIQFLWTDAPLTIPMTPAFRALAYSLCCQMDSVSEINCLSEMAKEKSKKPNITVSNACDDGVIPLTASLYTGLMFMQRKKNDNTNVIKCQLYAQGGHGGNLEGLI